MDEVKAERVGAVIVFRNGWNAERAQALLDEMYARDIIGPSEAHTFDPSWGGPVWYIP